MTSAVWEPRLRSLTRVDWRSTARSVVVQALLLFAALQAYQLVRRLAEGDRGRAFANGRELVRFERLLGLDVELGIQAVVLRSERLIHVANHIYVLTFWPVVIATLPILFIFARPQFRHYRNALIISGAVGLLVFAVYPVAPPRMLNGFVDTVHTFTSAGELAHPGSFTNQYAAMPSFHVGWLVLAGTAAMPAVPWRALRPLLLLPAAAMTFTVMATANHYLVDAIAGAAVALGGLYVSYRLPSAAAARRWLRAAVAEWAGSLPPMDLGGVVGPGGTSQAPFDGGRAVNSARRPAAELPDPQALPQLR